MKKVACVFVTALFVSSSFALAEPAPNVVPGHENFGRIERSNQSLPSFLRYSTGDDFFRFSVAPNYSSKMGWSLKGGFGSHLTSTTALGFLVEYGQNKREYLTNAGVQLTETLSFVGTVGMLEERNEYVVGEGRDIVRQMEYGASLKAAYNFGLFRGFEMNGYLADAKSKSERVEAGKLYGTQFLANVVLSSSTHLKIGGGYEWLRWDEGQNNGNIAFSATGQHQLTTALSLNGNVKVGASGRSFGGGLAYDLDNTRSNLNTIGLAYTYIDGRHGIQNDQRVELRWMVGLGNSGVNPINPASAIGKAAISDRGFKKSNNLLDDVMTRPSFLPDRVIARAKAATQSPSCTGITFGKDPNNSSISWFYVAVRAEGSQPSIQFELLSTGSTVLPSSITVTGANGAQFVVPASGSPSNSYGYYSIETGATNQRDPALAAAFPQNAPISLNLGFCILPAAVYKYRDDAILP